MLAAGAALGVRSPARSATTGQEPDLELRLVASPGRAQILRGEQTAVLRYSGEVLRGRRDALQPAPGYLGPTLELRRGERVRIRFENRLDEPSIVHWHGLLVPESADGHPRFAVGPGGHYVYEFTVINPAGTYLYHPHPHGRTGAQVYFGLAGLLIVREPWERDAGLPAGPYELALVIQDRRIAPDNQLVFEQSMMDAMTGVLGDTVLVNARADALYRVARRPYRLRLANVSNARIYKLAWSDGRPMRVIGVDNGLLPAQVGPLERPYLTLAPFERVELIEDFGSRAPGAQIALVSRAFSSDAGMGAMMGNMMGGGMMGPGQGMELSVARFAVAREGAARGEALRLPPENLALPEPRLELQTRLAFRMMRGFLNGRRFQMDAVARDERLPFEEPVRWTFENTDVGGMMAMPHPMHVHSARFPIVERAGGAPPDLAEGLVDAGYKDTVLVFPGQRVSVQFAPQHRGLFVYHCHNLEHEDGGMMRNYLVAV